jgi:hypothetical protein
MVEEPCEKIGPFDLPKRVGLFIGFKRVINNCKRGSIED